MDYTIKLMESPGELSMHIGEDSMGRRVHHHLGHSFIKKYILCAKMNLLLVIYLLPTSPNLHPLSRGLEKEEDLEGQGNS